MRITLNPPYVIPIVPKEKKNGYHTGCFSFNIQNTPIQCVSDSINKLYCTKIS